MHNASTPCNHEALRASPTWESLPSIGIQQTDELPLELRNCPNCHSTLSRFVPATALTIAGIVSMDARAAVHFVMPEGDVTALRDELEERYALSTETAYAWDHEDHRKVQRLVVGVTEDTALTLANSLEAEADAADEAYDEWRRTGRRAQGAL